MMHVSFRQIENRFSLFLRHRRSRGNRKGSSNTYCPNRYMPQTVHHYQCGVLSSLQRLRQCFLARSTLHYASLIISSNLQYSALCIISSNM